MFRRLALVITCGIALTGSAAAAQGLRNKSGLHDRVASRSLERFQRRMNLNETQAAQIRALQESRLKEIQSLRQESQSKRQSLRQLLRQPDPNPNEVGNAIIALRAGARGRKRDINARFAAGVKALLTPEQAQKLPKRLQ
jgi:Spy/CpxP family protein refolding chaperone